MSDDLISKDVDTSKQPALMVSKGKKEGRGNWKKFVFPTGSFLNNNFLPIFQILPFNKCMPATAFFKTIFNIQYILVSLVNIMEYYSTLFYQTHGILLIMELNSNYLKF